MSDRYSEEIASTRMNDLLEKDLISPASIRKVWDFVLPRLLATACVAGILVAAAAFTGTVLGLIDSDFRELASHHVREDLMWGLFLSQLVLLIPTAIWIWTRKWQRLRHDTRAQTFALVLKGTAIISVGGFISLAASAISARIYRFDYEFLGVSFMHVAMMLALRLFLVK